MRKTFRDTDAVAAILGKDPTAQAAMLMTWITKDIMGQFLPADMYEFAEVTK